MLNVLQHSGLGNIVVPYTITTFIKEDMTLELSYCELPVLMRHYLN